MGYAAKAPLREGIPHNVTGDMNADSFLVEGSSHTVPCLAGIFEVWSFGHTQYLLDRPLAPATSVTGKRLEPVFSLFFPFAKLGSAGISLSLKVEWKSCLEHDA